MPPTCGRISAIEYADIRPGSSVVSTTRSAWMVTVATSGTGGGGADRDVSQPPSSRPHTSTAETTRRSPRSSALSGRLLKKTHLLRWRAPATLRRTRQYASRRGSRAALHLDLFEPPGRKAVFPHPANRTATPTDTYVNAHDEVPCPSCPREPRGDGDPRRGTGACPGQAGASCLAGCLSVSQRIGWKK